VITLHSGLQKNVLDINSRPQPKERKNIYRLDYKESFLALFKDNNQKREHSQTIVNCRERLLRLATENGQDRGYSPSEV
jgi:hypothetical protein